MPINNITQTISELPAAGRRGVDVQTVFVNKQEDFQDHLQGTTVTELNTLKDQLNTRIGEINSTATTMNGDATSASSSATTATTKAGEASTSATAALTSKNQASTFATNSSNSATKASQWADNNYNVEVETGKYSAKHWATVAETVVVGTVKLTENQTIDGIKTFSSFPITPSSAPTTNYQVANKKYVDAKLVASSETVAGIIELATEAEAQNGTDALRAITPFLLKCSILGLGQTWQNVTASRVAGATYTNSTGKPIFIQVSIIGYIQVNGVTVVSDGSGGAYDEKSCLIPNGSTYLVSGTIDMWQELR